MNDITRDEIIADEKLHKLAEQLEKIDATKYKRLIDRCRNGDYLDFSSSHATPKMEMHLDLIAAKLYDIDKRMQDGEFDT